MRVAGLITASSLIFLLCAAAAPVSAATTTPLVITRPLHVGSRGTDVSALQRFLRDLGLFTYPSITDFYGSFTWKAVAAFQAAHDLESVGYVGPLTRALIAQETRDTPAADPATPASAALPPQGETPSTVPACAAPPGLTCIPGTSIIQPIAPGSGYTPGFGGGAPVSAAPAPDTTAPSVSLTAPASAATVAGSSVTLSATASDNASVAGVSFYVDGAAIGSEDTSSPYSLIWDSTATTSGSHSIVAVARDASGNRATSTAVSVTVDNAAPLQSSIASSTTDTTATISWTTDENASSKIVYGSTSSYGFATTSAAAVTAHSITVTGLTANTSYHFAVVSTDPYGNAATSTDLTFTTENYLTLLKNDSDLLALWRMNESSGTTLVDSKNAHTATTSGTVTLGTASSYVSGDSSTAATFDGSTGYASAGDVSALDFSRTSPFTISALIKPTTSANTNYWVYSKAKDTSPFNGIEFGVRKSAFTLGNPVGVYVQFGANSPSQFIRLFSDQALVNGQSYLVGVTYDGSGTAAGMHLYIDGNQVTGYDDAGTASQSIDAGQVTTAAGYPAQLGKWGSIGQYFKGDVKDVALFGAAKSATFMRSLAVAARSSNVNTAVTPSSIYSLSSPRPKVIIDADIDSDIDDVVDEVTLLNLEHRGELDIVGAIISSANAKAAPTWLAIANYYGRGSIPIGVNTSAPGASTSAYDSTIASTYGVAGKTDASNFPTATSTQRQLLAAAADHSIDYLTTGDLSSVQALLQTTADQYSSLSGVDLVAQKVHSLWIVGGNWPSGPAVSDFGVYTGTPTISNYVLTHWPTSVPILLDSISDGNAVPTGQNVMIGMSTNNPARAAWAAYFGNTSTSNTRPGWSQIALLAMARGFGTYMTIAGGNGTASINTSTGITSWTQTTNSNQSYLGKVMSDAGLTSAINALLLDPSAW